MSPLVIKDIDKIHLSCVAFHSAPVSQYYFYPEGIVDNAYTAPSCQLSLWYQELIQWAGQNSPELIKLRCYHQAQAPGHQFIPDHSDPAPLIGQTSDSGGGYFIWSLT